MQRTSFKAGALHAFESRWLIPLLTSMRLSGEPAEKPTLLNAALASAGLLNRIRIAVCV